MSRIDPVTPRPNNMRLPEPRQNEAGSISRRESSVIPRLYGLVLAYKRTVGAGMFCLILSVAAELYPPLVWQRVVDIGLAQRDWRYIIEQLVLLVVVFGAGQIFSAIRAGAGRAAV